MEWHTVILKVTSCFQWEPCLGFSGWPVQEKALKLGNEYRGFLKNTQTCPRHYPCCCAWHIIYFSYIKTGLGNKRWNWIKHHFRESLTVSMPAKEDVKVSQAYFSPESCKCETYSTWKHTGCSPTLHIPFHDTMTALLPYLCPQALSKHTSPCLKPAMVELLNPLGSAPLPSLTCQKCSPTLNRQLHETGPGELWLRWFWLIWKDGGSLSVSGCSRCPWAWTNPSLIPRLCSLCVNGYHLCIKGSTHGLYC